MMPKNLKKSKIDVVKKRCHENLILTQCYQSFSLVHSFRTATEILMISMILLVQCFFL